MNDDREPATGSTLFNVLRDRSDQGAWSTFVDRYGRRVYNWCIGAWRLQPADAENVTQEVLIKLFRSFQTFTYDRAQGSFRSWLKTVAHHAWQDYLDTRRQKGGVAQGGSEIREHLQATPAREEFAKVLAEEFDLELLEEAKTRVRREVSDRDWKIFQALALDGQAGTSVAAQHNLTVAAALMVRSRVQTKLRDTVADLEEEMP